MKIEIRNKPVFIKNAGIIIIAVILSAVSWGQFKINAALNTELVKKKEEYKKAKSAGNRLEKLKEQIQGLADQEESLIRMAPLDEKQPFGLIRIISGLAGETDLKNIVFSIKGPKDLSADSAAEQVPSANEQQEADMSGQLPADVQAGIKPINIEINFEGTFAQSRAFLKKLLNIGRLVVVEQINIERSPEILPYQKVSLELVAYTFTKQ